MLRRTLAMHGMLQISFGAPIPIIAGWIQQNGLSDALSHWEQALLARGASEISEQEWTNLRWYLEAMWALVWVGNLIQELPIEEPVGDVLASLLPNIQKNEGGTAFLSRFKLRTYDEVFSMLDLSLSCALVCTQWKSQRTRYWSLLAGCDYGAP
ncbi:MAG: DUF4272 domain-containing protein [Armatimonas sp.]